MIALFIGRFQPFHNGHLDALRQIAKDNNFIKIGIGSSQEDSTDKNPYSFDLRKNMIDSALVDKGFDYKIFAIPDINNDEKWVSHVRSIVGNFDIVYSGNDYVLGLFKEDKVKTKKQNFNLDISATMIRNKIKNKEDISKYIPLSISKLIN